MPLLQSRWSFWTVLFPGKYRTMLTLSYVHSAKCLCHCVILGYSLKISLFVFLMKASEELLINFGLTSNPEKGGKLDFTVCGVFKDLSWKCLMNACVKLFSYKIVLFNYRHLTILKHAARPWMHCAIFQVMTILLHWPRNFVQSSLQR